MKRILALILASAMVFTLASCGKKDETDKGTSNSTPSSSETTTNSQEGSEMFEAYKGLIKGTKEHYDGIEMMILQDRSLAVPGGTANIRVSIANKGDKKVLFVKGSGSNVIPDALTIKTLGLTNPNEGGIATSDFQTEALNPGESKEYLIEFKIPEENKLNDTVMDAAHDDGVAFEKYEGSVPGIAIFQFTALENETDEFDITQEPKGYVSDEFFISIAGANK